MRNNQGDNLVAVFTSHGCFLKGFVHESPAAVLSIDPAQYYRSLPQELAHCVSEPAVTAGNVTFCIWRSSRDSVWNHNAISLPPGDDPDGSAYLLSPLDGNPRTYRRWAQEFYERDVAMHAVKAIYDRRRLTDEVVAALNPDLRPKQIRDEIRDIGYPS